MAAVIQFAVGFIIGRNSQLLSMYSRFYRTSIYLHAKIVRAPKCTARRLVVYYRGEDIMVCVQTAGI